MLSHEAFVLGWPYWIGIGAGVLLYVLYLAARKKGDDRDA
jgi:hypothetical protein